MQIFKLGAMNREELSAVILKPAALLGVEFESGLADRILDDVDREPGNLALLEFALTKLWQGQKDNQLTHSAYESIGKVEGALAKYAEEKYQALKPAEQEQARQIFIQLVNPGEDNNDTRRRVNRQQIGDDNWDLVTRKGGLADSRLVVTGISNDERETLEVVHEALIRHWQRLQGWLNEDRENLNKQRQIENAAEEWEKWGKKIDYLLANKRLRSAKDFHQDQRANYPLSDLAQSFVAQSKKRQRNQRIKSLGLFLIIPLIGTYFVVQEINLNGDKKLIQDCVGKEFCSGRIQALERLVAAYKSLNNYNLNSADLEGAFLDSAHLNSAHLNSAHLNSAFLNSAHLNSAHLNSAELENANFSYADLEGADLEGADLVKVKNLTYSQIKSACNWSQAIYKGEWDEKERKWQIDEQANQAFIEQIKQDKASDLQEKVDCSRWE